MSNVAVVNGSTAEEVVSPGGPRHSAGRRGPHDETLAGLRGIACVLVVASHLWTVVPRDTLNRVGPFRGVFASGNLAVSVFLVLGGFLVTRGLLGEIDRTGSVSPFRFLVRRLVRIGAQLYPFLVAVVVVTWFDRRDDFTAGSTGASVGAAGRFTLNFQFIRDAVGSRPDMGHLWYLSVEMQFYVVWVVVLVWSGRYRRHLGVALRI
ncbi:hypothetical protein BH24ACT5_BH24ACT5_17790 [soil metagenome]